MSSITGQHNLPQGWTRKLLSHCAVVQTGVAKGRTLDPDDAISLPYLRVANVQDGFLDLEEIKTIDIRRREKERYMLQQGDVLLTEGGDFDKLGRGFVWNGEIPECVHQNHVFAVRLDRSELDPAFFSYQAQSSYGKAYFLSVAHKTTNLACINTSKLKAFPVLIPPLSEQKKIAHILSSVQRAIEAQERIIQTTTELKRALMHKLFTEGLRRELQKQTEIGLVPESWEVMPLSECSVVQTGIAKGRKVNEEEAVEVPYLRVANVQDGYLDLSEMKTIIIRKNEQQRFALQDGDVVLTEGGDFDKLGRGFIWHGQIENCVHQNHVFAVRPDKMQISSEFFAYLSQSPYGKRYFLSVAHKTTNLACINTTKLKAFPVLLPPQDQQADIVVACSSIDGKIRNATNKKKLLQDMFRALLHELMTAKTRVHNTEIK
ncbi:restriction endonuclease subunit S [Synechococcus sp. CBW1107]|uniref:restriction endonuclease subunit S n=1 Tax=Synechococcus sp. CBW1107 TaxID=2789857 RepID=UPI002AD46706|nr:restriction endonuclease subunit S [Synechococcus sp. CBW1107]